MTVEEFHGIFQFMDEDPFDQADGLNDKNERRKTVNWNYNPSDTVECCFVSKGSDVNKCFQSKQSVELVLMTIQYMYYKKEFSTVLHLCDEWLRNNRLKCANDNDKDAVRPMREDEVLEMGARAAMRLGMYQRALQYTDDMIQLDNPGFIFTRALVFKANNRIHDAIRDLLRFRSMRRQDGKVWVELGRCLFMQSSESNSEDALKLSNWANLCFRKGIDRLQSQSTVTFIEQELNEHNQEFVMRGTKPTTDTTALSPELLSQLESCFQKLLLHSTEQ